jgi:transposase
VSFVVKLMTLLRGSGQLAPKPAGGRRHAKLEPHRAFLLARGAAKADITMPELSGELATATGTKADPASLSRWLIRNGYRFRKNAAGQRTRSAGHPRRSRRMAAKATAQNAA